MIRKNIVNEMIKEFRFYFPSSNEFSDMEYFKEKKFPSISFYDTQTAWEDYLHGRDLFNQMKKV